MGANYLANGRTLSRAVEPEDLEDLHKMENDSLLKQYIENSRYDMFAGRQSLLEIVKRESRKVPGAMGITGFMPLHFARRGGHGHSRGMLRHGVRKGGMGAAG